ncbi:flagellar biosynthesis repressor FlbT [Methylobacterium sp. R2-1]|uniref:flagellar biosynthesis repressor FlbT n=1 Tax=Methylobacterium sp. R2-1 TaxID=2587064 RepID=UPI0016106C05|nr:flagellar biosynthesis repressor FlbT [Methylobacterium sp. R2-1]MBB2963830.1 flagellar protein FlbT [Methylobacterium sp. R2-1]
MTRETDRAAARTMHLSLKAGERVYINGAVVRVDRKVALELMNDATFLLEGHVLQAEEATTPLRQLYFAAQTVLIAPAQAGPARALYAQIEDGILAATTDPVMRDGLAAAHALVEAGRAFEALKIIRGLYTTEADLLGAAGPIPKVPPAALVPPTRSGHRRRSAMRARLAPSSDKA